MPSTECKMCRDEVLQYTNKAFWKTLAHNISSQNNMCHVSKTANEPKPKKSYTIERKRLLYKIPHLLSLFKKWFWEVKKYRSRFFEGRDQNIKTKYINALKIE